VINKLRRLTETNDHFHIGPKNIGELEVSDRPYQPADKLLMYGKVLFRTDDRDAEFFPHVLDQPALSK
jgi:hypothetical protein